METIKERIENLEAKFKELQCRFRIVEVRVADKLEKIEKTINKLSKSLFFNRVGETNNNPMLVSFKCHSQSIEKKGHDIFEGGLPLLDSQLVRDDPKVWPTRVEQFFDYQVTPYSQKVPLTSFHVEGEASEW